MRQRILGSHTPPCHRGHGHHHSIQCFALLHCSADQFCTTPGGFGLCFGLGLGSPGGGGGDCKGISRQTVVPSTDASKENTGEATFALMWCQCGSSNTNVIRLLWGHPILRDPLFLTYIMSEVPFPIKHSPKPQTPIALLPTLLPHHPPLPPLPPLPAHECSAWDCEAMGVTSGDSGNLGDSTTIASSLES